MASSGTRRLIQSMGEIKRKSSSQINDSFINENTLALKANLGVSPSVRFKKNYRPKSYK